jgi:hypothetical protein
MNSATQQKQTATSTDSIFGMALAQCFTGAVFGVGIDMAWEACEMADAVYVDRTAKNTLSAPSSFDMGKQKSLGGFFDLKAANIDTASAPMRPITNDGYIYNAPKPSSYGFSMAA